MQAISNWDNIQATNGGSSLLPMGGYICKITRVSDHSTEQTPYLGVVFDVWLPEEKRWFFGDIAKDTEQDWRHEFRFWIGSDFGQRLYKKLVESIEGTKENNGFKYQNTDGAEQTLVGKWVGFSIRHYVRTLTKGKKAGKEVTAIELAGSYTVDEIQSGDYPEPELRDAREKSSGNTQSSQSSNSNAVPDLYDEDIPF